MVAKSEFMHSNADKPRGFPDSTQIVYMRGAGAKKASHRCNALCCTSADGVS